MLWQSHQVRTLDSLPSMLDPVVEIRKPTERNSTLLMNHLTEVIIGDLKRGVSIRASVRY